MDVEAGLGPSYQAGDGTPSGTGQQPLPGQSKLKELQSDVNQLTSVMQSNINKVLERGDRMDTLNERSELLSNRANEFRINARNVRRKFWWQNVRFQLLLAVVIITFVVILIYAIRGWARRLIKNRNQTVQATRWISSVGSYHSTNVQPQGLSQAHGGISVNRYDCMTRTSKRQVNIRQFILIHVFSSLQEIVFIEDCFSGQSMSTRADESVIHWAGTDKSPTGYGSFFGSFLLRSSTIQYF